ncbi:MAG TPA: condensation domain-containing protein, partial [Acetobacteraceae bacterium]|nr:condensation domain-containing protein [Acetobacteraceae bacterium]
DEAYAREQYEAPQGAIEETLARIWQALLGVEKVGRHDNFFALGGHSLLAVRLVSQVRAQLGAELSLADLFAQPSLAAMAGVLTQAEGNALPPINPADRSQPLPLSFAEERVLAVEAMTPHAGVLNSSAVFQLSGPLLPERLACALKAVVVRHEILRTHYALDSEGGEAIPVIAPAEHFELAIHHAPVAGPDSRAAAHAEAARLPDCFRGPLFRASLFVETPERAWLVLNVHHIVIDARSWQLVWRDLQQAYAMDGMLSPLSLQYRDYAAWQRRHQDETRRTQLRHAWRDKLAGLPVCLNLPFDRARPAVMSDRAGHLRVAYPDALVRQIQRVATAHQLTPFVLLESSLAMLLGQLARSRDVVIGTVVEGRHQAGTESMVGLFVNTIALTHRVQPSKTVLRLWQQGVGALLWGMEHSELPFADIVAAVNPPRSSSHDPLFQVFCQFQQGIVGAETMLADVAMTPVPHEMTGRGADLAIIFQHSQDSLHAEVSYSADLFDAATVEAMVSLYAVLLSEAVQAPQASVEAIWQTSVARLQSSEHGAALHRMLHHPASATGAWYPLSPAQEAVWLQEQAAPPGSSYQVVAIMRCAPSVDRARLEAAARALIAQHQSFWLEWENTGLQHQALESRTRFERRVEETAIDHEAQLQVIQDWHQALTANPDDTMATVAVFQWPNTVCVAVRTHHVVNDGWSAIRGYERLVKNYALLEKEPGHVFEMDRIYLDTLKSEQAYRYAPDYERDRVFWQARCAASTASPLIATLADRPHATKVARHIHSVRRVLTPALAKALQAVADRLSVSLAECLTAVTALYLSRVSGEGDVTLGVTFLNRTREALDIPGQFAKALPLGLSFDPQQETLSDGIAKVRKAFRDVLQHGRYPLSEMVRCHGLDPRHIDIVVNTLLLKRGIELEGEPAHVEWLGGPESGLSLLFTQFGRRAPLGLELRFNRAVFDAATVERHADRLLQYLERVWQDLEAPLQRVPVLSDEECQ